MNYFEESFFKQYNANLNESKRQSFGVTDSYRSTTSQFDFFLSYNIKDKEVVKGIYYYLRSQGFKVYLDFIVDPLLDRSNVTKETALTIQNRLKHSKSLIYADSPNASMSKWMPWELGVVDGKTDKCAILPVVSYTLQKHTRQEYLSIYPIILPSKVGAHTIMMVENMGTGIKQWISLEEFLRRIL